MQFAERVFFTWEFFPNLFSLINRSIWLNKEVFASLRGDKSLDMTFVMFQMSIHQLPVSTRHLICNHKQYINIFMQMSADNLLWTRCFISTDFFIFCLTRQISTVRCVWQHESRLSSEVIYNINTLSITPVVIRNIASDGLHIIVLEIFSWKWN